MNAANCRRELSLLWWRGSWALLLLLALAPSFATAAEPQAKTVQMIVDYGDGAQLHFTAIPWRQDMTGLDAAQAAAAHPHGVKFVWRGAGSTAFVTKIGDAANEGSGRNAKNWMYQVNGKKAEVSIGSQKLEPGDVVLWKFQIYEYN